MKILKENLPGIVVLTMAGEFDTLEIARLSHEVEQAIHDGSGKIVLNMRRVAFMNSTALGALIRVHQQCLRAEGKLVISQPSEAVAMTIRSTGLEGRFAVYDDDQDAVEALDSNASLELAGDAERKVLIHEHGHTRVTVGRLCKLLADSLECRVPSETPDMVVGHNLRLNFGLPLYRKERFNLGVRIERRRETSEGLLLSLRYTEVSNEDQQAIEQFLADMEELRQIAHQND